MFHSMTNLLNKSLGSNKSSPEKSDTKLPNEKSESKMPPKKPKTKSQPKKICKLCKGKGCCTLCDRLDDAENMVWCSNKATCSKLLHYSCDNLTEEFVKAIKDYYCPTCRLEFEIVFYKKTTPAKQEEILNILYPKQNQKEKPANMAILNSNLSEPGEKIISNVPVDLAVENNPPTTLNSDTSEPVEMAISKQPIVLAVQNNDPDSLTEKVKISNEKDLNLEKSLTQENNGFQSSTPQKSSQKMTDIQPNLNEKNHAESESESEDSSENLSSNATFSSQSNIDDSFNRIFPGQEGTNSTQKNPDIFVESQFSRSFSLPKNLSLYARSLGYTPIKDGNLLNNKSYPHISLNTSKSNPEENSNRHSISETIKNNEKLTDIVQTLTIQLKNVRNENLELKKQSVNQKNLLSLENTIKVQKSKLDELEKDNLKYELEQQEARLALEDLITRLLSSEERRELVEGLYTESMKPIDRNERFKILPDEAYTLYKKQLNLYKKQASKVKSLIDEKEQYQKNLDELKTENEELRLKIVNLTENDIDKKILNFTINENKRLENKIKIQTKRNIDLGFEFRDGLKKMDELKEENKKLREKLKSGKSESVLFKENFPDEGWETASVMTIEPEDTSGGELNASTGAVHESSSNIPVTSPKMINDLRKAPSQTIIHSNENGTSKIQIKINYDKPKNESQVSKNSSDNTSGSKHSSAAVNSKQAFTPQRKKICKFFTEGRCKFGERCFNLHPKNDTKKRNYGPPWYKDMYIEKGYQPPRVQTRPEFNPFLSHNRFNHLPLLELDAVGPHGYWSLPHNPQLNNTVNYDHPANVRYPLH